MRRLKTGGALVVIGLIGLSLTVCSRVSGTGASEEALQQKADLWAIDQIEKDFHGAMAEKDIDRMMSLWAPSATLTVGPGVTANGVEEIRGFFLDKAAPFFPENHWISDHPAYKLEITVDGDRGTLHFECHFIDVDTKEVVSTTAADFDVARIDGKWLITNMVSATATL